MTTIINNLFYVVIGFLSGLACSIIVKSKKSKTEDKEEQKDL
jgi:uncharacterized membrane protein YuzA (DUF378 family)